MSDVHVASRPVAAASAASAASAADLTARCGRCIILPVQSTTRVFTRAVHVGYGWKNGTHKIHI
jgi:hypothetical protein